MTIADLKTEKIRAYLLDKGDFFVMYGRIYYVNRKTDEKIFMNSISMTSPARYNTNNWESDIGAKSRQFVLLLSDPNQVKELRF